MQGVLLFVGAISLAWYLLIVRPQKSQQHRHADLVGRLAVGDSVMTVGGIFGRVESVDGTSVQLELAPGLSTRVAIDAVARILPAGSVPVVQHSTGTSTATDAMHQHPQPQQQHQPTAQPQQGYVPAAPPPHVPMTVQQHAPPPVTAPTGAQYTFRAQVNPSAAPTHQASPRFAVANPFEPRPWTAAGSTLAAQHHAPQQHVAPAQPVYGQHAPPVYAPQHVPAPQHAHAQYQPAALPYAMQPAPAHQYAPIQGYAPAPQYAHAPGYATAAQYAPAPGYAPHPQYAPAPQHVAMQQQYAPAPAAPYTQHLEQTLVPEGGHRRSAAPEGMGQSARVDGELQRQFERARKEREELAVEYQRVTAPLVADSSAGAVAPTLQMPMAPQHHGVSAGAPLFLNQQHGNAQMASQYPAPARLPEVSLAAPPLPQPGLSIAAEHQGETAQPSPFQRPAPYSPQHHAQPVGAAV